MSRWNSEKQVRLAKAVLTSSALRNRFSAQYSRLLVEGKGKGTLDPALLNKMLTDAKFEEFRELLPTSPSQLGRLRTLLTNFIILHGDTQKMQLCMSRVNRAEKAGGFMYERRNTAICISQDAVLEFAYLEIEMFGSVQNLALLAVVLAAPDDVVPARYRQIMVEQSRPQEPADVNEAALPGDAMQQELTGTPVALTIADRLQELLDETRSLRSDVADMREELKAVKCLKGLYSKLSDLDARLGKSIKLGAPTPDATPGSDVQGSQPGAGSMAT